MFLGPRPNIGSAPRTRTELRRQSWVSNTTAACLVLERQTWRGADRITQVRLVFPSEAYELVARFAPRHIAN